MNDPVYNEIVVSDILPFSEMKKLKNEKIAFSYFYSKKSRPASHSKVGSTLFDCLIKMYDIPLISHSPHSNLIS